MLGRRRADHQTQVTGDQWQERRGRAAQRWWGPMAAVLRSGRRHQGDLVPDLSLRAAMPPGPLVLGQRMDPTYRLWGTGTPVRRGPDLVRFRLR